MFNPSNKQYESYKFKNNPGSVADTTTTVNPGTTAGTGASNMIASGQAFFVVANSAGTQSLLFRESAKVNTQPSFTRLNLLLGKPKETAEQPEPLLLLQLNKDSCE